MSRSLPIRRAPGERNAALDDLEKQLKKRPERHVVTVKASQAAPTGALRFLEAAADGDGTEDLSLTTGGTYAIPHGLGRPIRSRVTTWQQAGFGSVVDVDPATMPSSVDPDLYFAVIVNANGIYRFEVS